MDEKVTCQGFTWITGSWKYFESISVLFRYTNMDYMANPTGLHNVSLP